MIINETFARHFFPNEDCLGKRITLGVPGAPWLCLAGLLRAGAVGDESRPGCRIAHGVARPLLRSWDAAIPQANTPRSSSRAKTSPNTLSIKDFSVDAQAGTRIGNKNRECGRLMALIGNPKGRDQVEVVGHSQMEELCKHSGKTCATARECY